MGVYVGESVTGENVGIDGNEDFDAFVTRCGPDLRRVLVAHYGLDVGVEAAADALAYAWERWERVSTMENPTGYLVRVGQSAARRYRRRPVVRTDRDGSTVGDAAERSRLATSMISAGVR